MISGKSLNQILNPNKYFLLWKFLHVYKGDLLAILASKDFYNSRKLPPMELDMVIT